MKLLAGCYERFLFGFNIKTTGDKSHSIDSEINLPLVFNYAAHLGPVKSVAASGNVAVTGGSDDVIKIYDLKGKKDMGTLMHHEGGVTCLKLHGPTGSPTHLISGGEDSKVCVWDADSWQHLITLKGHRGPVNDLSIHPSGRLALSVSRDRTFRMWSLVQGKSALQLKLSTEGELVSFAPQTGSAYALGMQGGTVEIHDSETGKETQRFAHKGRVLALNFFDDNTILTAGEEATVRVWDTRSSKLVSCIPQAHTSRIRGLVCIPGSKLSQAATASSDGFLKLWDLRTVSSEEGKPVPALAETHSNARWTCLALSTTVVERAQEPEKEEEEGEEGLKEQQVSRPTKSKKQLDAPRSTAPKKLKKSKLVAVDG